jgi:hypothetical protein
VPEGVTKEMGVVTFINLFLTLSLYIFLENKSKTWGSIDFEEKEN